jgi:hypothetical protein
MRKKSILILFLISMIILKSKGQVDQNKYYTDKQLYLAALDIYLSASYKINDTILISDKGGASLLIGHKSKIFILFFVDVDTIPINASLIIMNQKIVKNNYTIIEIIRASKKKDEDETIVYENCGGVSVKFIFDKKTKAYCIENKSFW